MSEVKYVAISEELRDVAIQACTMNGWAEMAFAFRNAPQAEVKRHLRTRIDLAGAVAVNFKLPIAWAFEQPIETLVAMLTKIGVETTEVCR